MGHGEGMVEFLLEAFPENCSHSPVPGAVVDSFLIPCCAVLTGPLSHCGGQELFQGLPTSRMWRQDFSPET